MSFEHLFAPLTIGPMTVSNRLVMAPMERNYANPDGTVSERTVAHYRVTPAACGRSSARAGASRSVSCPPWRARSCPESRFT
jgi:2,4-dienoyl-CoA reductase-like NADH-dependent reductase (Old Yellow Enzyme family)